MRKLSTDCNAARWITIPQAREILQLSRGSVLKVAEEKGALKRIGRSVRIDIQRILED